MHQCRSPKSYLFAGVCGLLLCSGAALADEEAREHGLHRAFSYIGEVFSYVDGAGERGSVYTGLAVLELDYQNEIVEMYANFYAPHGNSLTDRFLGDFSVASNIDTLHEPRLQELWLERRFGNVSLRAGMLAADTEYWSASAAGIFVSSAFGAPSSISGNLSNPSIFPTSAFGLRLGWDLQNGRSLRVLVQDGDSGDPLSDNRHGLDVDWGDGVLALAEYEAVDEEEGAAVGTFKLSAFVHSGKFTDSDGVHGSGSYGVLAIVERALGPRANGFVRGGIARRRHSLVPFSIEAGVVFDEVFGSGDKFGIGVAYVDLNDSWHEAMGIADLGREIVVEATYELPFGEYLVLQPDLQYIVDPGGARSARDALVFGLRARLDFAD